MASIANVTDERSAAQHRDAAGMANPLVRRRDAAAQHPEPRMEDALPPRLKMRVARGSAILFDLDDTLVVATEVSRASPVFQSHAGYATVVQAGNASLFVAVRPFTLAALASLANAGLRVGFWSAGSPLYVSAIVERLVDAVRHMQILKQAKRSSTAKTKQPISLFTPVAVVALDQQNMNWVRDNYIEGVSKSARSGRYRVIMPARVDAALGTVIKEPGLLAPEHPHLSDSGQRILLVDNLRHDPDYTLHVKDFVPGAPPRGSGYGGGGSRRTPTMSPRATDMDRVLLDVARSILGAAQ
jgi:hypothetical protein